MHSYFAEVVTKPRLEIGPDGFWKRLAVSTRGACRGPIPARGPSCYGSFSLPLALYLGVGHSHDLISDAISFLLVPITRLADRETTGFKQL